MAAQSMRRTLLEEAGAVEFVRAGVRWPAAVFRLGSRLVPAWLGELGAVTDSSALPPGGHAVRDFPRYHGRRVSPTLIAGRNAAGQKGST